jgi:hypothetical protein
MPVDILVDDKVQRLNPTGMEKPTGRVEDRGY